MDGTESRIHNVTILTSSPRDGAALQFLCTFRYVFPQIQVRVRRFVWYLNGVKLNAEHSQRLKINVTEPDDTGTWLSTLTFNPASHKDAGNLTHITMTFQAAQSKVVIKC